jgi:hypothetical protein
MLYGFLLFAELPDLYTLLGAAIIVASTLYIARREHVLNRPRQAAGGSAPRVRVRVRVRTASEHSRASRGAFLRRRRGIIASLVTHRRRLAAQRSVGRRRRRAVATVVGVVRAIMPG